MIPRNFTASSMAFKPILNSKDGSELRVATAHMVEVILGNFTDVDLLSAHGKIGDYMVK